MREFTELLKGCRPVKDRNGHILIQSILNMQLVCLTTDAEYSMDERFANPLTAVKAHNQRYGQITFTNNEGKETIVPTNMAILSKQHAQNHGMVKSGYIPANDEVTFNDAGCVQGSESGYLNSTQEFRVLPVTMREMLFEAVGQTDGHGNIYPAIQKLGRDTQSNTDTYVDRYYSKYDKKLEQFIAHFERPDKLIGIIVLIDGEIVAVDKFPSFNYAEQVWETMIRDCYGALAIISELKNKSPKNLFTETYESIGKRAHQRNIVDLIEKALKKTKETMSGMVEDRLQELLELTFDETLDVEGNPSNGIGKPKSYILKNEGYIGQVFSESEFNHMVSIVKKESFNPNAFRIVNEMRNKARNQERFSL